jgi:homoserine/homoserine lactone efflux protein
MDEALKSGFYRQGILVNLGNPKAIVFIAALVPQFIDPAAPKAIQFLVIGITMFSIDVAVMSGYALLAGRFRNRVRDRRAVVLQNRMFGAIFVGAGCLLAGASRH